MSDVFQQNLVGNRGCMQHAEHVYRIGLKHPTYWQKIANLPTPLSFNALARGEPFKFLDEPYFLGLSVSEDFRILACIVLTQCQHVTDECTNGQTTWRWLIEGST